MIEVQRIFDVLTKLGDLFKSYTIDSVDVNDSWTSQLQDVLQLAEKQNSWFTPKYLKLALSQWQALLTEETLAAWTKPYTLTFTKLTQNSGYYNGRKYSFGWFSRFFYVYSFQEIRC